MVPDKPQKVENFHFTWCGYIGFRTRWYVKQSKVDVSLKTRHKRQKTVTNKTYPNWSKGK